MGNGGMKVRGTSEDLSNLTTSEGDNIGLVKTLKRGMSVVLFLYPEVGVLAILPPVLSRWNNVAAIFLGSVCSKQVRQREIGTSIARPIEEAGFTGGDQAYQVSLSTRPHQPTDVSKIRFRKH